MASGDRPYLSSSFREALASLYYGLEYGVRVLLLSGERGVGKTTLLRYWERRVHPCGHTLFVSANADNASDVMQNLMLEIGGLAPGHLNSTGLQTDDIFRTLASPVNPFILLLDFNGNSGGSALDILNHLTRFESFRTKSLRIAIAVSDEVTEQLQRSEFAHDIRRVPVEPMKAAEVEGYIEHRLRIAGWRGGPLFTPRGYASIAESSSGNPSIINEICFKLLQKLSESENGTLDAQGRNPKIPVDQPLVDPVFSVKKPASTEPPDNTVDEVVSPARPLNRRLATIASIVLIPVITIAGLWYEIAMKANSAKGISLSTIPRPAMAQHEAIPLDSTVARLPDAAQRTHAGVAAKTVPVTAVGARERETSRALSPSPAPVSFRDAGYSEGPVDQRGPKIGSALSSSSPSASPIAILSSVPARTQPSRSAIASVQRAAVATQAGASKERAEEMAAHEIKLGDTYMRRGEYDKALFSFSRALAFAPNDQEAREKLKRAVHAKTAEENVLQ
jgi:type II secretory pathway predicted ATPase ExeA